MTSTADHIRALNDSFRARGPAGGDWLLTVGIQALGADAIIAAVAATVAFSDFTPDNDPYREHDFGRFEFEGQIAYWKIDYYDLDLEFGSPDPANEQITRRVLTILLASEY